MVEMMRLFIPLNTLPQSLSEDALEMVVTAPDAFLTSVEANAVC